ncbi:MAG: hypothetical protein A3H98_05720, partial [Bacteroidetes bacterium RIFCSPLOWO2_02_FULL_36_8]
MDVNLEILPLSSWVHDVTRPVLISGPCSAETEEQVLTIARELVQQKITFFRSGIWKPRTRPNVFEGVGSKGLPWLNTVQKLTGLKVTIEVATARHVESALKHSIDVLWIGARSTANPFVVQEIADALKGVDIPVLVKNPINPDLGLWLGALERLNKNGIKKLAAIHRGFSVYETTRYRNIPTWQIPIDLKLKLPQLPVFCDPSHIAGKRDLIFPLSQKAMDLNFDGLMIECHHCPEKAWSDAEQQITPDDLRILLLELKIRADHSDDLKFVHNLEDLRERINKIDREILDAFGKRMELVRRIGDFKREHNVTILQSQRWEEIIQNGLARSLRLNLSSDFITGLYKQVHDESIRNQNLVMNAGKGMEIG